MATQTHQPSASVFDPSIRELPRGYTGLPRELIEASQRQRLLHGLVASVGERGYATTTITQIAERAGVAKKTFYEHFDDKQACFLSAYDVGRGAMLERTRAAAAQAGGSALDQLGAGVDAYCAFISDELPFARVFFLEALAAGPEAVARQRACRADFTTDLQRWHRRACKVHADWPKATPLAYEAATGAVHEVTLGRVAADRADQLRRLARELRDIQLAVLRVPMT